MSKPFPHCGAVVLVLLYGACFANPTPHPQQDAGAKSDVAAWPGGDAAALGLDTEGADLAYVADTAPPSADAADPDVAMDGAGTDPDVGGDDAAGQTFACGEQLTCGSHQYCQIDQPGACGGPPPGPSGCGPDCSATVCSDGQSACVCLGVSCAALPVGCTSCGCLPVSLSFCDCDDSSGNIVVQCSLP